MNAVALPAPGAGQILLGVPAEEYHRRELGVVSAGVLRRLNEETPAHYRAWIDEKDEADTPAKAFGKAYHDRVLLPDLFAQRYVGEPVGAPARPTDAMRNAKKPSQSSIDRVAFWDAWDRENAGKIVLSADDFAKIEAMHAALVSHRTAAGVLFGEGDSEVTLRWVDPATGLRCKARTDRWARRLRSIADLKTADDASPQGFARAVVRYGYDVTAAHYTEGARECGEPIDEYLFVVQEKAAPYLVAVYRLDAEAEARGYRLREDGMNTMAECMATNTWPGYPAGVETLALPGWATATEMEISYVDSE